MDSIGTNLKRLDITTVRGDSFIQGIRVVKNNLPFDFTNCTAKMQLKVSDETAPVLEFSTANATIVLQSGRIDFNVPASTMNITPLKYYYDLQINFPNGVVKTWLNGFFIIKPDVTQ